jgi:hypothetical protein
MMEFVAIYTNSRLIHKEKLAKRSQYYAVMWIKLTAIKMDRALIMDSERLRWTGR